MFYRFAHFVAGLLFRLLYRLERTGRENVPSGGALICANHTSLADPIFVALALKVPDQAVIMAKSSLFKFKPFAWLIMSLGAFPVQRGKSDIKAIKLSIEKLKEGRKLMLFPEGTRNLESESARAKTGAIFIALKAGVPIVPVYLSPGRKPFINKVVTVIGKPMLCEDGTDYQVLADRLMAEIWKLRDGYNKNGR